MTMKRTALYGGAFDPVHIGHIELAKQVNERFGFDKFLFVPTNLPPHKHHHSVSSSDRFNMLQIVADELGSTFGVCDLEVRKEVVSYTLDTLKEYKQLYPEEQLYFICGSDIFSTIKQWNGWEQLFDYAKFIVVSRTDTSFDDMFKTIGDDMKDMVCLDNEYDCMSADKKVILFKVFLPDISSTYIKENVFFDTTLVSSSVLEYINRHKLYKG